MDYDSDSDIFLTQSKFIPEDYNREDATEASDELLGGAFDLSQDNADAALGEIR